MPETPDPLTDGMLSLRTALGDAPVHLDVVGLIPLRLDHERHRSRAEARVLVTADAPADAARALLTLQADAVHRLEPVPDALWGPLGRPPQAAFIVVVPFEAGVPYAAPPLIRHALDVQFVPVPAPHPDATRRP